MNKQEAIDKIKNIGTLKINDTVLHQQIDMVVKNQVLDIISQIHEPEKPVVPRCVSDMIVKRKKAGQSVVKAIENLRFYEDACRWVRNNGETFVKAWLFGYEVKKKKLYEVFLKRTGAQLGVCVPHGEDKAQFTKVELQEYGFDDLDVYDVKEVEE